MPATQAQPVPSAGEIYNQLTEVNHREADIRRLRERIRTAPQVEGDRLRLELDDLKSAHRTALMRWSESVRVEADHAEAAAEESLAEILPRFDAAEREYRTQLSKATSDAAIALQNQKLDCSSQIGAARARRTAADERVRLASRSWWGVG